MGELPKPGDVVETKVGKKWVRVIVNQRWEPSQMPRWPQTISSREWVFQVHRENTNGIKRMPMYRAQSELKPARRKPTDLITANVFADWLDDNAFPEAAAALRTAFPLAPEE